MKFITFILFFFTFHKAFAEDHRPLLVQSQKIIFLGDSITYSGEYVTNFDVWLHAYYSKRKFEIFNLGLPSETISGLSEKGHAGGKFLRPNLHDRLNSVLEKTKPDLIFACYGMNCGIQKPFNQDRFKKYQDGIIKLKTKAEAAGSKIIFITPPYYDGKMKTNKAYYTDVLKKYSAWLVSKRKDNWNVIDLNSHMTKTILEKRKQDPNFTVQKDAIHPDKTGHWMITQSIISYFGDSTAAQSSNINEVLALHKLPASITTLTEERSNIMRDALLTLTGHKHPKIKKGEPIEQALKKSKKITSKIKSLYKLAGQ